MGQEPERAGGHRFVIRQCRRANDDVTTRPLYWISLCNLCVLCVSVFVVSRIPITTESQRTQRLHREAPQTKTLPRAL